MMIRVARNELSESGVCPGFGVALGGGAGVGLEVFADAAKALRYESASSAGNPFTWAQMAVHAARSVVIRTRIVSLYASGLMSNPRSRSGEESESLPWLQAVRIAMAARAQKVLIKGEVYGEVQP